jgi:uncharacterized Zn finger protein (UPF0148 family)
MFDNLLRELRKMDKNRGGLSVPIQMTLDGEGYFDRQCPSANCQAGFKVFFEDWRVKVSDERVFCPICREEAKATEWNTAKQVEQIKQVCFGHLQGIVNDAMERDVREFNRQPQSGFITLSLSFKPGAPVVVVPTAAAEELRQKFTCEGCRCRYSSLGAAFFCPACGHNSAVATYSATMEAARKSIVALPAIREAVQTAGGRDDAENTIRLIIENNLVRVVGAFQAATEGLFDRLPRATKIPHRRNAFQSLAEGSALWRQATGKGYNDLVSVADISELSRYFQQRHLLAHCEGMVDEDYIKRSEDGSYSVGQRLVIREGAVNRAIDLAAKLIAGLSNLA